jgi:hypothetical protein
MIVEDQRGCLGLEVQSLRMVIQPTSYTVREASNSLSSSVVDEHTFLEVLLVLGFYANPC